MGKYKFSVGQRVRINRANFKDVTVMSRKKSENLSPQQNIYTLDVFYKSMFMETILFESELTAIKEKK